MGQSCARDAPGIPRLLQCPTGVFIQAANKVAQHCRDLKWNFIAMCLIPLYFLPAAPQFALKFRFGLKSHAGASCPKCSWVQPGLFITQQNIFKNMIRWNHKDQNHRGSQRSESTKTCSPPDRHQTLCSLQSTKPPPGVLSSHHHLPLH